MAQHRNSVAARSAGVGVLVGGLTVCLLTPVTAAQAGEPQPAPPATTTQAHAPEPAGPVAQRGDVRPQRFRFTVDTPRVGQQTVFHAQVKAATKPTVKVRAAGGRGTVRVTAVGGVRTLPKAGHYTVTVSALKPKAAKANSKPGRLRIVVGGKKLRLVNRYTYLNAFTRKAEGGRMCRALSAFDIGNTNPRARVKFQDKILFGRKLRGFSRPDYLGTFSLLRACTGKSVQSFENLMRGKRAAAVKRQSPVTAIRSVQSRGTSVPDAVVLVSGFMSQTPFTSPGGTCSTLSAGGTWSVMQSALANQGYPVFTAPATSYSYSSSSDTDPTPVAISPESMGLGSCANSQLPASMTINTAGDFDLNSSILASFLNYLYQQYGLQNVWLVGHSDGGLWSRGALDYASYMPNTSVVSITTIDTPWTGAFLANLGFDQAVQSCPTLDVLCDAKEAALNSILNYFSPALDNGVALEEMTSDYMSGWNSRMAGVPGPTPFYAASAIGLNDPDTFNTLVSGTGSDPFYNPNDVAVGISSQQADGLVANGTISNLACFATIPGLHTELPSSVIDTGQDVDLINTYPGSTTAVTTNPMNITNVTNVLSGNPPTTACPSADYQQSGEYAPGQYGSWPDNS